MRTVLVVLAWVTAIGYPIEPFEACKLAQTGAVEIRQHMPDLEARAACETPKPDTGGTIVHLGPRSIIRVGDSV